MVLENFLVDADILWDRAGKELYEKPEARAGRKMRVRVTNRGVIEDLTGFTLNLGWTSTKDETKFGLDAFDVVDATKGLYELDYTSGMLTNIGTLKAALQLVPMVGNTVESNNFVITVSRSAVDAEAIQSETSFTALTSALVEVQGWNARIDDVEQQYIDKANNLDATYPTRLVSVEQQLAEKIGGKELGANTDDLFYPELADLTKVKDNFIRANNTDLGKAETGQTWQHITTIGKMVIENNRLKCNVAEAAVAAIDCGLADCEIAVSLFNYRSGGASGVAFRIIDNLNYWRIHIAYNGANYLMYLSQLVNGVNNPKLVTTRTANIIDGAQLRVVLTGRRVVVSIEQDEYIDYTMPIETPVTSTIHGVSSTIDNYTAFSRFSIKRIGDQVARYPNALIASVNNMLVNYVGHSLFLSEDGGASYLKRLDIPQVSIIKFVHLFQDGKIMFADHQKVYYSHDWKTYAESVVTDSDGTPFVPSTYDNFSCYKNGSVPKIVSGTELAVWGNYSTVAGMEYTNRVRTWYTADKGITVKCAYRFNMAGTAVTRHIHNVDFNPTDSTFWLQTGDLAAESHWIKGTYTLATDTWTWVIFASGLSFKSTNMVFKGTDVYWSWDKTPGGVVKAPYATLADTLTHTLLYTTNKDCNFIIVGPSGDILAFQTNWGGTDSPRVMYYAPDGITFNRIVGAMPPSFYNNGGAQYQAPWPINAKGKILAGIQDITALPIRDWDRKPSIFIDDIIREYGFPNAFR